MTFSDPEEFAIRRVMGMRVGQCSDIIPIRSAILSAPALRTSCRDRFFRTKLYDGTRGLTLDGMSGAEEP